MSERERERERLQKEAQWRARGRELLSWVCLCFGIHIFRLGWGFGAGVIQVWAGMASLCLIHKRLTHKKLTVRFGSKLWSGPLNCEPNRQLLVPFFLNCGPNLIERFGRFCSSTGFFAHSHRLRKISSEGRTLLLFPSLIVQVIYVKPKCKASSSVLVYH